MKLAVWIALLGVFIVGPLNAATPKDNNQPDKEMLQMMELLNNMEIIKQIDLMQDMQKVEPVGEPAASTASQKSSSVKKKEAAK
jgi:hypothetical protein